jgi:hypothetical protein
MRPLPPFEGGRKSGLIETKDLPDFAPGFQSGTKRDARKIEIPGLYYHKLPSLHHIHQAFYVDKHLHYRNIKYNNKK